MELWLSLFFAKSRQFWYHIANIIPHKFKSAKKWKTQQKAKNYLFGSQVSFVFSLKVETQIQTRPPLIILLTEQITTFPNVIPCYILNKSVAMVKDSKPSTGPQPKTISDSKK